MKHGEFDGQCGRFEKGIFRSSCGPSGLRLLKLIKGDLFFLARYGLFYVYAIFIAVYLIILHYIPGDTGTFVMKLLVFSDPAAMGLFFMGAVVLLEKSQRVNCSIAVSPVTTSEYTASKAVSFLLAGLVVGLLIAFGSGRHLTPAGLFGVAGSSMLFSLGGLFVASKTRSLNQFIICTLPVEIFISVPGFLFAFDKLTSLWWIAHPGVAAMGLLFKETDLAHGSGNAIAQTGGQSAPSDITLIMLCALSLVVWNALVFLATRKAVDNMFKELGGGSL